MADTQPNDTLTKGFSHNWRNHLEVDVSQSGLDPTNVAGADFETLDHFITGITHTPGDVIDTSIHWDDKDNTSPEVTGHARTWAVTGNVLQGDPACAFFQKIEDTDATGTDACALFRYTKANGSVKVFAAAIENVVTVGGNGNANSTMTLTIAQRGTAVQTQLSAPTQPTQPTHPATPPANGTTTTPTTGK